MKHQSQPSMATPRPHTAHRTPSTPDPRLSVIRHTPQPGLASTASQLVAECKLDVRLYHVEGHFCQDELVIPSPQQHEHQHIPGNLCLGVCCPSLYVCPSLSLSRARALSLSLRTCVSVCLSVCLSLGTTRT